jgi:hypothetical protein
MIDSLSLDDVMEASQVAAGPSNSSTGTTSLQVQGREGVGWGGTKVRQPDDVDFPESGFHCQWPMWWLWRRLNDPCSASRATGGSSQFNA